MLDGTLVADRRKKRQSAYAGYLLGHLKNRHQVGISRDDHHAVQLKPMDVCDDMNRNIDIRLFLAGDMPLVVALWAMTRPWLESAIHNFAARRDLSASKPAMSLKFGFVWLRSNLHASPPISHLLILLLLSILPLQAPGNCGEDLHRDDLRIRACEISCQGMQVHPLQVMLAQLINCAMQIVPIYIAANAHLLKALDQKWKADGQASLPSAPQG